MKKIISALLTATLLFSAAYTVSGAGTAPDTASANNKNTSAPTGVSAEQSVSVLSADITDTADRISNGGFEVGLDNWNIAAGCNPKPILTEEAPNNGIKCLYLIKQKFATKSVTNIFTVSKNTDYILEFYYRGSPASAAVSVKGSADIIIEQIGAESPEWKNVRIPFNSGNNTSLTLTFEIMRTSDYYIDDVSALQKNELIKNGGFENAHAFWNCDEIIWSTDKVTMDGNTESGVMHAKDGENTLLYQSAQLTENKKYEISFDYKGNLPTGISYWSVSAEKPTFERGSVCAFGTFEGTNEVKKVRSVFKVPKSGVYYINFQSVATADYVIDNVSLKMTDKTAGTFETGAEAEFVKKFTRINDVNRAFKYIPKNGANIISGGDFETDAGQWHNDAFLSDATLTSEPQAVHSGLRALKIGSDREKTSSFYIDVEPNTEYILGVWVKGMPFDKDSNLTRMSLGAALPDTGKYIYEYYLPAYDGEWHLCEYFFKTNANTKIAFKVTTDNTYVYMDDMFLCRSDESEEYKSPGANKAAAVLKFSSEQRETCAPKYNLTENYRLDGGNKFWGETTGTAFGRQVTVNNSGDSSHGNALHYKVAARATTGKAYPQSVYYIKYIAVAPYTDYTFSMDYLPVSKPDNGNVEIKDTAFGLLDSGELYPTEISTKKLSDCTFNSGWKSVTFKFNSGGHNKIGFFVFDGGGEIYFDNISLFKSSLITNCGFDDPSYWSNGWWYQTKDWYGREPVPNKENGTNCLYIKKVWQGVHYGTSFEAEPYTNYTVTFNYKGNPKWAHARILTMDEKILSDKNVDGNVNLTEWKSFTMNFNSGPEGGKRIFAFVMENGSEFYVDDVYLTVMAANNITIVQPKGGKIYTAVKAAAPGERVIVSVSPNSGRKLKCLTVTGDANSGVLAGSAVEGIESEANSDGFIMPGYDVILSAEFDEKTNLLSNGSFDNKDWWATNWWYCTTGWWGYSKELNGDDGTNCLYIKEVWQGVHYGTSFESEPYTNYTVTFNYKGNPRWAHARILTMDEKIIAGNNVDGNVNLTEWKNFTMSFNSGPEGGKCIFAFVMESGSEFYVDDVYITPLETNKITVSDSRLSVSVNFAEPGAAVKITAAPETGKRVKSIVLTGDENAGIINGGNTVKGIKTVFDSDTGFTMPGYNVTVSAEYTDYTDYNRDGVTDIRDLIRIKKLIAADSGYKNAAEELAALRKILLGAAYSVKTILQIGKGIL